MTDESRPPCVPSSDELLRVVVESAADYAIFSIDPRGVVTSWNLGAERLLGYAESEIISRDGDVIFTPEDRDSGAPEAERETAAREGRAEDERWHVRKDGSRFWGSGMLMPLVEGPGFVKILRDLTDRHAAQEQLRENEERFRLLATNIPQLVFRSRATGDRTWGSPQWEVFTGLSDGASRGFGWVDAIHLEDREATLAAWREAQETGEYYVEHRVQRAQDGAYRWHQTRARPIDRSDSTASEWVGSSADVHDMRMLQERQAVILAELQHRTRNTLAVVQAITLRTLEASASLEEFGTQFNRRLSALSRVQGLLARVDRAGLNMRALVEAELAAHHGGEDSNKVRIEGPPVRLTPVSAQALALAIHELATNAVKYGALHQPSGRLSVRWRVDGGDGAERRVVFEWQESGVTMPDRDRLNRKGYGSELIEQALPYQLQAETLLEFGGDGVRCMIAAPIAAKAASNA